MILGVDSSGTVASVAILSGEIIVAEYTLNNKLTHSQTLLPMIEEAVRRADICLEDIEAIAVAKGPGSFTGLRIGASTVKGLGLVLKIPVIPIPTLEAMACQMFGVDRVICPIMDARRGQVYTGLYEYQGDTLCCIREQEAMDMGELLGVLQALGRKVIFMGDGVPVFADKIKDELQLDYLFAPAFALRQRAASVAVLGQKYWERGEYVSAAAFAPEYLRESQAERERREKEKQTAHEA